MSVLKDFINAIRGPKTPIEHGFGEVIFVDAFISTGKGDKGIHYRGEMTLKARAPILELVRDEGEIKKYAQLSDKDLKNIGVVRIRKRKRVAGPFTEQEIKNKLEKKEVKKEDVEGISEVEDGKFKFKYFILGEEEETLYYRKTGFEWQQYETKSNNPQLRIIDVAMPEGKTLGTTTEMYSCAEVLGIAVWIILALTGLDIVLLFSNFYFAAPELFTKVFTIPTTVMAAWGGLMTLLFIYTYLTGKWARFPSLARESPDELYVLQMPSSLGFYFRGTKFLKSDNGLAAINQYLHKKILDLEMKIIGLEKENEELQKLLGTKAARMRQSSAIKRYIESPAIRTIKDNWKLLVLLIVMILALIVAFKLITM